MNVQSLAFLAFLTVTVCVCRLLPKERTWVLLAASLVFYLWGGAPAALWGCGLLAVSSFVSYLAANTLRKHRRKSVLLAVVCYHIAVLGIFKYTVFFTGGAVRMPFVPLGISFFTFQQIWYLREVYAGTFSQVPTPAEYLTYSFFFPTVSSGPILKPENFFPQLREASPLPQDTAAGLYAIGLGLAKKVLLANVLYGLISAYKSAANVSVLFVWLYAAAYVLHLYFDFSGYSDMAIGLGRIFGFHFIENFNYPYISASVTEFWRRWHMSLGSWFRDYVYIPLGGNRVSKAKWFRNIFIVWLLTGLWHGAAWTFILWGLFFAVFLTVEKLWYGQALAQTRFLKHLYVLLLIAVSFVIFDAASVSDAFRTIGSLFGLGGLPRSDVLARYYFDSYSGVFLVAIVGATPLPAKIVRQFSEDGPGKKIMSVVEPVVLLGLLAVVTAYLVDGSFNPFLYFRF